MSTDVTVIIPTVLRPELERALESVRAQDYRGTVEVLVVADVPADAVVGRAPVLQGGERILVTGGGMRGGGARNLGVRTAQGEWVAYLDDDDEWTPEHLSSLFNRVRSGNWHGQKDHVVLATRAWQVREGRASLPSSPVPARPMSQGERVEDYLFRRRQLSLSRPSFFTPTMLVSARLARLVLWNSALPRHQDWDWLVRAQAVGAVIEHVAEPSCIVRVGSSGSISAASNWEASLDWVRSASSDWARATVADFITGQCLRYALSAGSIRGALSCIRAIAETRCLPAAGPILLGLAGLAGRRNIERAMFWKSRRRIREAPSA